MELSTSFINKKDGIFRKVMSSFNFSKTRKSPVINILVSIVILFSLTGCFMKKMHYKSFLDLRREFARNYSLQVLDSIVGLLEHAELPVFFNVEAGQSTWRPTYTISSGNAVAVFDTTKGQTTSVTATSPSSSSGESVTSTLQYNDFGSGAMSRINALYAFLCLPMRFGETTFPNGALYTIVEKSDSPENFILSSKIADDSYIGVTKEKRFAFLRFSNDVSYWARHEQPETTDLASVAGNLYRFSFEYSRKKQALVAAIMSKAGAQASISKVQQALKDKSKEFENLKSEAKTTKTNPQIMQTLLQYKQKELETKAKGFASVNEQISKAEVAIKTNKAELENLLLIVESTLQEIIDNDPDIEKIKAATLTHGLHEYLELIVAGDKTVLDEELSLPRAKGLDARESRDDLYRERFEALPPRFGTNFQAVD